jgi:hypothetical protein
MIEKHSTTLQGKGTGNNREEVLRNMDKPKIYRICVEGRVHESWVDRLGGMRVSIDNGQEKVVTVLEGQLRDQAALSGVLNTLYELHLPVISVDCLEDSEETQEP